MEVDRQTALTIGTHEFIYKQLEHNEIRLLRILPELKKLSRFDKDLLQCTLEHASLDAPPLYNALSYVWGTDPAPYPIVVQGRLFEINLNLYTALCEFWRSATSEEESVDYGPIWIDALCFNQKDHVERSVQVQRMAQIYKQSDYLLVWLGPETATTRLAFSVLTRYAAALVRLREEGVHTSENLVQINREEWSALGELASNKYFSRCWVLQEYALGGQKICSSEDENAVFWLCGSDRFKYVLEMLKDTEYRKNKITVVPNFPMYSLITRRRLLVFSRLYHEARDVGEHWLSSNNQHREVFLYLACLQSSQESTDPRDKIYSILGLTRELNEQEMVHYGLLVDYEASVEDVFSSSVKAMVQSSKRLTVLGAACRAQQSEYVSRSWTPDWTQGTTLDTRSVTSMNDILEPKQKVTLDADCVCFFAEDLSTLTVRGFSLGEVTFLAQLSERVESACEFENELRAITKFLKQSPTHCKQETPYSVLASFCVACVQTREEVLDPMVAAEVHQAWSLKLEQWIDTSHPAYTPKSNYFFRDDSDRELYHLSRNLTATLSDEMVLITALNHVFSYHYYGAHTFVSDHGHIGLCDLHLNRGTERVENPSTVRVGDILCVILGCGNPLILRPKDNGQFELISEAWVPSIMNGEAMEQLEQGQWELQDFELC